MNKTSKILLIIAGACIVFGTLLCIISLNLTQFFPNQWDENDYHSVNHTVTDSFTSIRVEGGLDSDLLIQPAKENQKYLVVTYEQESLPHTVRVENGTLIIGRRDERKWYDHITLFSFKNPHISIYLPEATYDSLYVDNDTGDIITDKQLVFGNVDIRTDTGDVAFRSQVIENLAIKTSTGRIDIRNTDLPSAALTATTGKIILHNIKTAGDVTITTSTGAQSISELQCRNLTLKCTTGGLTCESVQIDDALQFNSSTGRVTLTKIRCGTVKGKASTGDINCSDLMATGELRMETSTGEIKLTASDAATLNIKTDTGDVEGTLLSDKIFYTETDTGNIQVPKSTTGGICEVITDTGSIRFEILS